MRISELADTTGVSVATIKFYLREGLLPAGRKVAERMADYDEGHVRRLRLLRLLRDVGDVSVDRLRAVVAATEDRTTPIHDMFGAASDALAPRPTAPGPERAATRLAADHLIDLAGWTSIRGDSIDRENLAVALEALARAGVEIGRPDAAAPYLELADQIGRFEIAALGPDQDRVELLERMVVGQVVFGELLMILRRLAEEHHSAIRFGGLPPSD